MKILNLTQHEATPEQKEAGVVEPKDKNLVKHLLTFDELPTVHTLRDRAHNLLAIMHEEEVTRAMIGGAPFFMPILTEVIREDGNIPLFAFSLRESVEVQNEDGSVSKQNVFRHKGFVEV